MLEMVVKEGLNVLDRNYFASTHHS